MLSEINIDNKTLTLLHNRRLINNQQFNKGEINMAEYNIDSITNLTNKDVFYYPKRIFSDLLPFLVEIIENNTIIKTVYCFALCQHNPLQNPHDMQVMNKDIEVEVNFQTDKSVIKELITNCINNMEDYHFLLDDDIEKSVTLTVVKIELLKEQRENKINFIKSYKDDICVICVESKPNILFCNCGHNCICEPCFNKLENNKCPKCREINKIIRKI